MKKKKFTKIGCGPYLTTGSPLIYYFLTLLSILLVTGFDSQAQTEKRLYTVGNSVTDGVNFEGFKALAESRGYVHTLARHMIPGAPLSWLWDNQDGGFITEPYGTPSNAFPNYTWDAISLQPFDRMIEGTDGDFEVAKRYIDIARGKSPDVQFYIYSRYPRDPRPTGDSSPLTADMWNDLWLRTYTGGYDGSNESRDFFEKLILLLRTHYSSTSLKQPLMIPVGEVMYSLNNQMKNGQVPGFSSIWDLYADGIHVTNVGSYLVACTFFATMYKESPVGLPVPSQYGTISDQVKTIIQQTVWEVITTNSSWTGISGGSTAVTDVAVSPTTLSLAVNQTGQLNAVISPGNASNKTVSWSSSNTDVATVSATGLVTGRATGSAAITVTTQDGSKTATASVSVINNAVPVTGVTVSPDNVVVNTGNTVTLTATVLPLNATNKNITWSSNTAAATVSATGVVTGVSAGYASIFATTQDGSYIGIAQVQVTANSKPTASISATPTSGSAPLVVQFSASNSTDPNPGDFILGFYWDFGDGSPRANSNSPSHTYTAEGTYTVTLRVMDNHDLYSDPVSTTITVNNNLRNADNPSVTVAGLDYKYYEGNWSTLPNFDALTVARQGNVANFDLTPRNRSDNFGFTFTGYVDVPADGTYTFYTSSDDGSKLYIGSTQVVNNDGLHGNQEQSGTIGLKAGKHALTVTYFEATGGETLSVSYSGPGLSKQTIPASALYRSSTTTAGFSGTYQNSKLANVIGGNNQQWKLEQLSTNARLNTEASSEAEVSAALSLYPNPVTTGRLTLELQSKVKGQATVTFSTVMGQRKAAEQFSVEKGPNTLTISTSGLASGLYVVSLQQGSHRIVKKVYVQ